jgi:hypothetical protein
MLIVIDIIDHADQRYNTLGDYWTDSTGTIQLRVSRMRDPNSERAVILHELFELFACLSAGVDLTAIDRFDMRWKPRRDIEEPGEDPRAPYFIQHQHAMAAERHYTATVGLPWVEHERNCAEAETMGRARAKLRKAVNG